MTHIKRLEEKLLLSFETRRESPTVKDNQIENCLERSLSLSSKMSTLETAGV